MPTNIHSTNLDFESIKNNLKTALEQSDQFNDYDFEASGLNNLLDVLAYNTHYNALTANFGLNESFLNTAQLRSSVVSLAEGIGYIPKSKTSAQASVRLTVDLSGGTNIPNTISIPPGVRLTTSIDDTSYTFQTRDTIYGTNNGVGGFNLYVEGPNYNIPIFEGTQKTKKFIADRSNDADDAIYVIPDVNMDTETAIIRVYESATSSAFTTYQRIQDATTINDDTRLYVLKESPNGYFELSFGSGNTLGQSPQAGYRIEVDYLAVSGVDANNGKVFTPTSTFTFDNNTYSFNVTTVTNSIGGADVETIDSIRKNAPFQYATQNRMVTAADYSSLVLRNFKTLITDIQSYGGEEALEPEFGAVYMSIVFNDDATQEVIDTTKTSIGDLVSQLAVVSYNLRFVDPVKTFIETDVFFQFNPKLTTLSQNTITDNVNRTIADYFTQNTGKFNQSFRRSNLLTLIDEVSPAILSSRMDIRMQQRITPILNKSQSFKIRYPAPIAATDDENARITSSTFFIGSTGCIITNQLSSTKLQVVSATDRSVVVDNVGSFDPANGIVNIVGLKPTTISGGVEFIKISATPANQSAISPQREDILVSDTDPSFATGVVVSST